MNSRHSKSDDKLVDMTRRRSSSPTTPEDSLKGEKKNKFSIPKLFNSKRNGRDSSSSSSSSCSEEDLLQSKNGDVHGLDSSTIESKRKALAEISSGTRKEKHNNLGIQGLNLSNFHQTMAPGTMIQDVRVFVGTWNLGGKPPDEGLNLEELLKVEASADLYVFGFQEIVPLSAGNVLGSEDNEPAAKWLALISHTINKQPSAAAAAATAGSCISNSKQSNSNKDNNLLFHKPSLKVLSKNLGADKTLIKSCNCPSDYPRQRTRRTSCCDDSSSLSVTEAIISAYSNNNTSKYRLVARKQMVGLFLSVWARKEMVQHIGHLRISCVGRGIMGCLRNKGCISISFSLHRTNFCFVCSHLASGEREGDELRRNADVGEILKNTNFSRLCNNPNRRIVEKITDHDRSFWLGDLNYRISLTYDETRVLLEAKSMDYLLDKDQLNIEREAGRVFHGWHEGKIIFAPTYKYSPNSDNYTGGDTVKCKEKRRTPAWCDRILWRGDGIEQLSYFRGESRFSDHRPVCAVFAAEIEKMADKDSKLRKGYSCAGAKLFYEVCSTQTNNSFYGL